ncbi:MAG: GNAT family N-acetyltransferase [Propionibacterium sp.]|nr:MAG: GNAT family N-acetyltransferase [Propionibacterium sp.]
MPDVVKVRLALPAEAPAIAEVQRASWATSPALKAGLAEIDLAEATAVWHQIITRPPLAHYRVLVAMEVNQVVGFTLIGPSDDEDAEETDSLVHEFIVAPYALRQGHGSRLMQASVDTMQLDGYQRATWWVETSNDVLRKFLAEAGWAPDGAHRELATSDGAHHIKQVRLHTDISTDT